MVNFFSPNTFDALVPKIPFSFFAKFSVWVTFRARGQSVGFLGARQLSHPFWGGGGGCIVSPPQLKAPSPIVPLRPLQLQLCPLPGMMCTTGLWTNPAMFSLCSSSAGARGCFQGREQFLWTAPGHHAIAGSSRRSVVG